jgi:hypothetical protein
MRRAIATTLSVTALFAIPVAGCGQSDKDKYVDDYKPLNNKLVKLGDDVVSEVNGASSKSNTQLAAAFSTLGKRIAAVRTDIAGLDTPTELKDESKGLTDALSSAQSDVEAISKAAKESDPTAAQAASKKLATDADKVTTNQNKLAKATGAKIDK